MVLATIALTDLHLLIAILAAVLIAVAVGWAPRSPYGPPTGLLAGVVTFLVLAAILT